MIKYLSLLSSHRGALMGVAILWVLAFHLPLHTDFFILKTIFYSGYGGVDIFLFLSGFGLYFSMSQKNTTVSRFYRKRFCRILPEFWLYLTVMFIISMDFDFRSFLRMLYCATTIGYWIPGTPYILWYISCILFFYAIFPLYFRLFKKRGSAISLIAIIGGLVLTVAYGIVSVICFNNENRGGLLILTIARVPIFFIGALFGHWAKNMVDFKLKKVSITAVLVLFAISLAFLLLCKTYLYEYRWTFGLSFIPFIIITPVLCVLVSLFLDNAPRVVSTFFTNVGSISLELYIVHEALYTQISSLSKYMGHNGACFAVLFFSFVAALILHWVNKIFLQRLFAAC